MFKSIWYLILAMIWYRDLTLFFFQIVVNFSNTELKNLLNSKLNNLEKLVLLCSKLSYSFGLMSNLLVLLHCSIYSFSWFNYSNFKNLWQGKFPLIVSYIFKLPIFFNGKIIMIFYSHYLSRCPRAFNLSKPFFFKKSCSCHFFPLTHLSFLNFLNLRHLFRNYISKKLCCEKKPPKTLEWNFLVCVAYL